MKQSGVVLQDDGARATPVLGFDVHIWRIALDTRISQMDLTALSPAELTRAVGSCLSAINDATWQLMPPCALCCQFTSAKRRKSLICAGPLKPTDTGIFPLAAFSTKRSNHSGRTLPQFAASTGQKSRRPVCVAAIGGGSLNKSYPSVPGEWNICRPLPLICSSGERAAYVKNSGGNSRAFAAAQARGVCLFWSESAPRSIIASLPGLRKR